ncbi:hypothetical protein BJ546DRAFT_309688 [Cryomyces antarcticus]
MSSPSAPPSIPSSSALRRYLSGADSTLGRLTRILSTTSGVDTTLLTLGYSLTLVSAQLQRTLEKQLERFALSVVEKASDALLPGETLVATLPTPDGPLAQLAAGSKAAADLIADFRIFLRLWGLLSIYQWAKSTYHSPPADGLLRRVAWAQVAVNAAYQYLENGAYLAQHGILPGRSWTAAKQTRWWVWSSRFWAAHVVLDFVRLARVRQLRLRNRGAAGVSGVGGEGEKEDRVEAAREETRWWDEIYVNAAYAPLTLHWSLEEGCVSEAWVSALGTIAGVIGFRELWKQSG